MPSARSICHGRFEQPLIAFLSEEPGEIYSHFLAIGVETREEAIALLERYAETAVTLRASLAETA